MIRLDPNLIWIGWSIIRLDPSLVRLDQTLIPLYSSRIQTYSSNLRKIHCILEPRLFDINQKYNIKLTKIPTWMISEQGQNTSKKKTTFSRLLRGLKTHRKEKQGQSQGSPRHGRARMGVPQRVSVLYSYMCHDSCPSPLFAAAPLRQIIPWILRGSVILSQQIDK